MQVTSSSQQAIPAPTAPVAPGQAVRIQGATPSPSDVWRAARERRSEIRDQISAVRSDRAEYARALRSGERTGADKAGLETRVQNLDARLAELDKQLSVADQEVAQAAGVPGAVVPDPPFQRNGPPDEVFVIPIVFTIFVLAPIAVAYARRIWKRSSAVVSAIPDALMERLARMEQAVDAIALEVERVSEGQRFLTKVMTETPRGIGAGAAQPVEVKAREGAHVPR